MLHEKIASAALGCRGTPFHHQGRVRGMGLDCIGVVVHALKAAGIEVNDATDYSRSPENGRLEQSLIDHGFEKADAIQAGDVLLFRFNQQPQHVGVAVSDARFVHAFAPAARVVETGLGEIWQRRLVAIYRYKE